MAQELGSKRIIGLDIIRSLAILSVMASHILGLPYHKYRLTAGLCGVLAIFGVEVFFVLSGYLIGGIFMRDIEGSHFDIHTVIHFWKRRWFRTLPNYYLFLIVSLVVAVCTHAAVVDLYKYFFFWQNLTTGSSEAFFGVSWSLCLEEWAYLLLPIVGLFASRFIPIKRDAVMFTIALFLVLPMIFRITGVHNINSWDDSFRKGVVFHLDGIFFGVTLALFDRYYSKLYRIFSSIGAFCLGIISLLVIASFITYMMSYRHFLTGGSNILPAALVNIFLLTAVDIAMMPIVAFCSRIKSLPESIKRFFVAISTYSYALYLCHTLVFGISYFIVGRTLPINRFANIVIITLDVLLAFAIAIPVYHLYEKRVTKLRELVKS